MAEIGISYDPNTDLFLSGANQTAIVLGKLFLKLGYNVTLINIKNSDNGCTWWDGVKQLSDFKLGTLYGTKGIDMFIDIDGYVLPSMRNKIAAVSVVFLRTFLQFAEMDRSVYPETEYRPRDFSGVKEVWCWDILNPPETLTAIQTIFPCAIRRVPFVWSSWVADTFAHRNTVKKIVDNGDGCEWSVYICEKNNINSSSCTIPIVAVRELVLKNVIKAKYKCYNAEKLKENKFFKENVYNNIQIGTEHLDFYSDGGGAFYKMLDVEGSVLFSHSRFTPLRTGLLNALWMGLPIIHNSPIIRSLHQVLNSCYYTGNNIKEICERFNWLCNEGGAKEYYSVLQEIRENIVALYGIDAQLEKWREFFGALSPPNAPLSPPVVTVVTTNAVIKIIAFSDMWPGFNYNSNFIMDALRNEIGISNILTELRGVKYDDLSNGVQPDLVIFGPYSEMWKSIPDSIPKVFFSGENWGEPQHHSIKLWLTASRTESDTHIRIPTWMTFINWFSNSKELPSGVACEDNPIRLPLELAMRQHPIGFKERPEFCGFVVSNPICGFRNETFKVVDSYKRVNSGGALFNNIGGQLSLRYPGGGCGDISKYHFFERHKFTISFENSQAAGYITEKVLHAKMAGCVPLYWGDSESDTDFVPGSIVNLSKVGSPEQVLEILKRLDANPDLCAKIAGTPILDEEKKQKAIQIMSNMSRKLLGLLGIGVVKEEVSIEMLHKINKTFIVNLDTRRDRWTALMAAEPYLEKIATRVPAVNGKTLKMNDVIYRLFSKNQFKWKKSVIGCSMSHFSIWSKICSDSEASMDDLYLVLEDDVRFINGWRDLLRKAIDNIPMDAELLYLGGVLPPNKVGLAYCQEMVNDYWSCIKPNTLFSPTPLPIFHFCTYSYIISKRAVHKLVSYLTESELKSHVPVDHLLGNPNIGLKKYIMNPLIGYCFQDEDPEYVNSNFNEADMKGKFDSDIQNNTECFTEEDISNFLCKRESNTDTGGLDIYYYSPEGGSYDLYERVWLEEITKRKINMKPLPSLDSMSQPNNSWFIVQRPHMSFWNDYFKRLDDNNIGFKVLHLSDEFGADNISFYKLLHCKQVVRNYLRGDISDSAAGRIITIPLGPHYAFNKSAQNSDVVSNNGKLKDRKLIWSFHGTGWFGRKDILEGLSDLAPHSCHITPDWNHSTMTRETDYVRILSNTRFVPILRGNNVETFRLYEALEAGCVPIYVSGDSEYDKMYSAWLKDNLGLIDSINWFAAKKYMSLPEDKYEAVENYRTMILDNWCKWKERIRGYIARIL